MQNYIFIWTKYCVLIGDLGLWEKKKTFGLTKIIGTHAGGSGQQTGYTLQTQKGAGKRVRSLIVQGAIHAVHGAITHLTIAPVRGFGIAAIGIFAGALRMQ